MNEENSIMCVHYLSRVSRSQRSHLVRDEEETLVISLIDSVFAEFTETSARRDPRRSSLLLMIESKERDSPMDDRWNLRRLFISFLLLGESPTNERSRKH